MNALALVAALVLAASAAGGEFADVGLSRDAGPVLDAHLQHVQDQTDEHCVRGEPAPWLEPGKLATGTHAYRSTGPTSAIETVVRSDGSNITILEGGCESYAAAIRYVFPLRRAATDEQLAAHAVGALQLLRRLDARPVFDLAKAEAELERRGDLASLLKSGEEVPVPGDGEDFLQTRIVITRVGRVDGGGFVELLLVKGPL
jgi:hypothetical protein